MTELLQLEIVLDINGMITYNGITEGLSVGGNLFVG